MTAALDVLPWLNLLLIPGVSLLASINAKLVALETQQAAHAEQLRTLQDIPADMAAAMAVQTEHSKRLDLYYRAATFPTTNQRP